MESCVSIPTLHFPHTPIFLPASGSQLPSHYSGESHRFPSQPDVHPSISIVLGWQTYAHTHYNMVYIVSPVRSYTILVCWPDYSLSVCVMPCVFCQWLPVGQSQTGDSLKSSATTSARRWWHTSNTHTHPSWHRDWLVGGRSCQLDLKGRITGSAVMQPHITHM